jgi:hypothetical protein
MGYGGEPVLVCSLGRRLQGLPKSSYGIPEPVLHLLTALHYVSALLPPTRVLSSFTTIS